MKKLLIFGGGVFQVPFVQRAKEMGLYVGLVDINIAAPAKDFCDVFFNTSILDIDKAREIVKSFNPDGITVGTCETGMHTASIIGKEFNLPFLDEETVKKATNKVLMLEAFKKIGVPSPEYKVIKPGDKVEWTFDYPVITKPADKSASRGLYFVNNPSELNYAVDVSMSVSDSKEVLIEEYLDGPEVSVEILMIQDKPKVLQITDKITSGSPYYIELGQAQPSTLTDEEKIQIANCASNAAISVGLSNCAVHAEVKMTSKGPRMVELGGRMGGHFIDSYLLENSTGYRLQDAIIRYALGEPMTITQEKVVDACAMKCILSREGVVKDITGVDKAKAIEGIVSIYITTQIGQSLHEGKSNNDLIGYIVGCADNTDNALAVCERAENTIKIIYE